MVYFIFWHVLIHAPINYWVKLLIILTGFVVAKAKARKAMLLTLIFALTLYLIGSPIQPYNVHTPKEGMTGYIYKLSNQKSDCYINGEKYKLKSKDLALFQDGDAVTLSQIKMRVQDTHNVHGYDYEQHYRFKGYAGYIKASLTPSDALTKDIWYRSALSMIRRYFRKTFDNYAPDAAHLANALLLGDLGDQSLTEKITSLGIIHLFVISGFHFNVVSVLVFTTLHKVLKCPYKFSQVLLCGILGIYYCVIFSGYGSQRALFMTLVGFLAFCFNQRKDAVLLTLFYAAFSLYLNPLCYTELGFMLTNITVIVVTVVSRKLKAFNLTMTQQNLLISLAVFSVIHTLIIYQNGSVNYVGVLLVPLLTPIISVFIIGVLLHLACPLLIYIPFYVSGLNYLSSIIYGWIDRGYQLKGISLSMHPHIALFIAVVMCLYFLLRLLSNHGISKKTNIVFSIFVAALVIISTMNFGVTIKSYALYDGEAYLIQSQSATIIYDVGNDPDIIEYLKKDGVEIIDLIVISHSDQDHIGMLDNVLANFDVKEVILDIKTKTKRQVGDFKLNFYKRTFTGERAKNNSSISMLLENRGHTMLFTGDLQQAGGTALLEDFKGHVDILKVPHHGSYNPVFNDMLKAYTPHYCFISGGRGKRINKSKIYKVLTSQHLPFYDTMVDGEVTIDLSGDDIDFTTYFERGNYGIRQVLSGH